MSSSKIMRYNLDDSVLDGVAMESTSEEILEKVENGVSVKGRTPISVGYNSVSPSDSSTYVDVCELTGKGKILLINTSLLKIEVDGNLILNDNNWVRSSAITHEIDFEESIKIQAKKDGVNNSITQVVWQLF